MSRGLLFSRHSVFTGSEVARRQSHVRNSDDTSRLECQRIHDMDTAFTLQNDVQVARDSRHADNFSRETARRLRHPTMMTCRQPGAVQNWLLYFWHRMYLNL